MIRDLPELMTVDQMAELIGNHPGSVQRKCRNGTIPSIKVGQKWLIPRDIVFKRIVEMEKEFDD